MTTSFDEKTHSYLIDGKPATGVTTVIGVLAKPALIGWAAKMAVEYVKEHAEFYDNYSDMGEAGERYLVKDTDLEEARTAHTKKKEAAGTHGTEAHALVEKYIKSCMSNDGKPYPIVEDGVRQSIGKFVDWAIENVDHFLYSERRMFNKDMFVAGTADFGCVMKDGKKLIGDFKTSSGVYGIDYFLQCAGYKILAEAEGDTPYDGCVIVRLGKKGPADFDVHYRYTEQSTKSQPEELWKRLMGFLGKKVEMINYSDVDSDAFMACLTLYRAQATFKKV